MEFEEEFDGQSQNHHHAEIEEEIECVPISQFLKLSDYYEILSLDKKKALSQSDIRRAFYRMSKRYHPDVNSEDGATEAFKKCVAAYECLSDVESRNYYDETNVDRGDPVAMSKHEEEKYSEYYRDSYYEDDLLLNLLIFEKLFGWRSGRSRRSRRACNCPDCRPDLYNRSYRHSAFSNDEYSSIRKNNTKREFNSSNTKEEFEKFDVKSFLEEENKRKVKKNSGKSNKRKKKKKTRRRRFGKPNKQKNNTKKTYGRAPENDKENETKKSAAYEPDPFSFFSM